MRYVEVSRVDGLAVVTLRRGKVNALDEVSIDELRRLFDELESDSSITAVVLTGHGKFFSFGFDVPHLFSYSKTAFSDFVRAFASFYTSLYVFPKAVVAALNGHTIAGGCMLAIACDRRVMASGNCKISLNEITFAASVFAGSVEMLKACVGHRNAETILYSGSMYTPEVALRLGLVDRVSDPADVLAVATDEARELAAHDGVAFAGIKALLRQPVAEQMRSRESDSIRDFVDIWYSPATRERLAKMEIRR
jgi:enoyl-CoA hydratase/carnithine racemase